ncbi:MAG TPA: hypothetical protein VLG44_07770 [Chlamydiales bacterium]|nr:hypothetical protein [Chlamydiales bacterium]
MTITIGFMRPLAGEDRFCKPSAEEITAVNAKWNATDPALIAELNKPIPIRGIGLFHVNEDRGESEVEVVSLKIPPGSTLAQIKPIFDARIAALTLQRAEVIKQYRALAASLLKEESKKSDKKCDPESEEPSMISLSDSAQSATIRQQCVVATQMAHLQLEIDVLNSRFKPALDLFAILQKA